MNLQMHEDEIPVGKAQDLRGQTFNKLTVLYRTHNRGKAVMWKCKCECGTICIVQGDHLKNGHTTSCGCKAKERMNDITGQKFGKLTVIEPTNERKHNSVVWKCQCDCGNITYATTEGLRVGDNTTCGCSNKAREKFANAYKVDFTNKKFGKLTVLGPTDMRTEHGNQVWKCQCECGNICYVSTNHLQTGNTQSCGCLLGNSIGENKIKQILIDNNIKFKAEYIFSELPNRRYDFALLNENNEVIQLIEFDGEQHYIEAPIF